jgi:hypothetical protein
MAVPARLTSMHTADAISAGMANAPWTARVEVGRPRTARVEVGRPRSTKGAEVTEGHLHKDSNACRA